MNINLNSLLQTKLQSLISVSKSLSQVVYLINITRSCHNQHIAHSEFISHNNLQILIKILVSTYMSNNHKAISIQIHVKQNHQFSR